MGHAKVIIVISVLAAGIAGGVRVRASETTHHAAPAPVAVATSGVGEELILVIAGVAPTPQEAAARLGAANAPFAHVQGFVAEAADDYEVTGVHVQISADLIHVDCPEPGAGVARRIDGVVHALDCPVRGGPARVLRPVDLSFVPRDDIATHRFPAPCGTVTRPPCQRDRVERVVAPDGGFRRGTGLLLTAFRTRAGAEAFLELARTLGTDGLVTVSARKLGGGFVGLGQEPHPDGSGPLLRPLPDQTRFQR